MHMCLIATVQHHGSAVYINNALHSLLYPTVTSSWLQGLPFTVLFTTRYSMHAGM